MASAKGIIGGDIKRCAHNFMTNALEFVQYQYAVDAETSYNNITKSSYLKVGISCQSPKGQLGRQDKFLIIHILYPEICIFRSYITLKDLRRAHK
jgi:hypothetical protein